MRYDLIVFDWDGTLMDSAALIAESLQTACREVGGPVPNTAEARHVIGMSMVAAIRSVAPDLAEETFPRLFESYRRHYLTHEPVLRPFAEVGAMLEALDQSGHLLAVATGKPRAGLERALESTGFKRHFVATRCADEENPKPAPDMLNYLMDVCGVSPAQTLMIGDTSHDLLMAGHAGVDALAVTYGAQPRATLEQHTACAYLDSVPELWRWLSEQG